MDEEGGDLAGPREILNPLANRGVARGFDTPRAKTAVSS
jgi:hypothetical protein